MRVGSRIRPYHKIKEQWFPLQRLFSSKLCLRHFWQPLFLLFLRWIAGQLERLSISKCSRAPLTSVLNSVSKVVPLWKIIECTCDQARCTNVYQKWKWDLFCAKVKKRRAIVWSEEKIDSRLSAGLSRFSGCNNCSSVAALIKHY